VADLFLDTFPYNAGTIASDAIRMGLPLLTMSGQSFASRMAGRLLTAIGATEGVATTLNSYIERAVAFATDRAAFETYRRGFDSAAWRRRIGDIEGFARSYEDALRGIVKRPD
jgi:predicted O-linked N-acetylglucosamine transferase (SPINDLY family)